MLLLPYTVRIIRLVLKQVTEYRFIPLGVSWNNPGAFRMTRCSFFVFHDGVYAVVNTLFLFDNISRMRGGLPTSVGSIYLDVTCFDALQSDYCLSAGRRVSASCNRFWLNWKL